MRYGRILIATLGLFGFVAAAPGEAEARPGAKRSVKTKAPTRAKRFHRAGSVYFFRYRRLRPEVLRRAQSGEHPKSQVAPEGIPGR